MQRNSKRNLIVAATLFLVGLNLNAAYTVVLKNGTRYRATERWTVQNGKAMVKLENGTVLQLDPALIDVPRSDAASRSGLGDAIVLNTGTAAPGGKPPVTAGPSLSELSRTRGTKAPKPNEPVTSATKTATPSSTPPLSAPAGGDRNSEDFVEKLQQAYENVGIFEYKVAPAAGGSVRAELVADSEDQVFKAISATAFVMANVPLASGQKIETLELFMKTVRGGSAGRFQMKQTDADAIFSKKRTWQDFFVEKVLF